MDNRRTAFIVASVLLLLFSGSSCKDRDSSAAVAPVEAIKWRGQGGGFREWGRTPEGLFGVSVRPEILETWKWDNGTLEKDASEELPGLLDTVVIAGGKYLACKRPDSQYEEWPLVLGSLGSAGLIRTWPVSSGWFYRQTGASRNGEHLAVAMRAAPGHPPAGYDVLQRPTRIGVLNLSSTEIRWLVTLTTNGNDMIRELAVSDDGKYVAAGGWDNGVALVDTTDGTVLWNGRPPNSWDPEYVEFSPDGSKLYAGDGPHGCVYRLETRTGKVLGQWWATETGEPVYGHQITCIAVSHDESWIAAGTGPEGHVYLFNARTNEKPLILPHGLSTILEVSFSPDSKRLASMAGGQIKIWDVPRRPLPVQEPVPSAASSQPGEERDRTGDR